MKIYNELESLGFFEWLKEKGFNSGFTAMILDAQPFDSIERTGYNSIAFRWFREKYHIIGEVKFQGGKTTKTAWYDYVIYSEIDWNDENLSEQWKKHEAAELACLKKLIEIVKEKK